MDLVAVRKKSSPRMLRLREMCRRLLLPAVFRKDSDCMGALATRTQDDGEQTGRVRLCCISFCLFPTMSRHCEPLLQPHWKDVQAL